MTAHCNNCAGRQTLVREGLNLVVVSGVNVAGARARVQRNMEPDHVGGICEAKAVKDFGRQAQTSAF
jgi:hypothetical protein